MSIEQLTELPNFLSVESNSVPFYMLTELVMNMSYK